MNQFLSSPTSQPPEEPNFPSPDPCQLQTDALDAAIAELDRWTVIVGERAAALQDCLQQNHSQQVSAQSNFDPRRGLILPRILRTLQQSVAWIKSEYPTRCKKHTETPE